MAMTTTAVTAATIADLRTAIAAVTSTLTSPASVGGVAFEYQGTMHAIIWNN